MNNLSFCRRERYALQKEEPRSGAPRAVIDADVERVVTYKLDTKSDEAARWSTRGMAKAAGVSQFALDSPTLVVGFADGTVKLIDYSTEAHSDDAAVRPARCRGDPIARRKDVDGGRRDRAHRVPQGANGRGRERMEVAWAGGAVTVQRRPARLFAEHQRDRLRASSGRCSEGGGVLAGRPRPGGDPGGRTRPGTAAGRRRRHRESYRQARGRRGCGCLYAGRQLAGDRGHGRWRTQRCSSASTGQALGRVREDSSLHERLRSTLDPAVPYDFRCCSAACCSTEPGRVGVMS